MNTSEGWIVTECENGRIKAQQYYGEEGELVLTLTRLGYAADPFWHLVYMNPYEDTISDHWFKNYNDAVRAGTSLLNGSLYV